MLWNAFPNTCCSYKLWRTRVANIFFFYATGGYSATFGGKASLSLHLKIIDRLAKTMTGSANSCYCYNQVIVFTSIQYKED